MTLFLFTLLSTLITLGAIVLLKPLAHKLDLVDQPNSLRKQHKGKVPLIGGICILFAVSVVCMLSTHSLSSYRSLFLGSGILLFVGVLDDFTPLSAKFRLLVQSLVVIIMIGQGGLEISNLGDFLSIGVVKLSPVYAMLLTFISVIALVNAMNMLDGQDGLLGLISLSQFIWLAVLVVASEFFIVISRFIFEYEQAFQGDLVRFWYSALYLFASAYALMHEGHVRVDVLYTGFSERKKAWTNSIGSLVLGIPLCLIVIFLGMVNKASIINGPVISFEITQQGSNGLYLLYLMAIYLAVFAVSMLTQFTSYFMSSSHKLLQN